jgi:hypothetical protein
VQNLSMGSRLLEEHHLRWKKKNKVIKDMTRRIVWGRAVTFIWAQSGKSLSELDCVKLQKLHNLHGSSAHNMPRDIKMSGEAWASSFSLIFTARMIGSAIKHGITKGKSKGTFSPLRSPPSHSHEIPTSHPPSFGKFQWSWL